MRKSQYPQPPKKNFVTSYRKHVHWKLLAYFASASILVEIKQNQIFWPEVECLDKHFKSVHGNSKK